jgi:hypothetical protein
MITTIDPLNKFPNVDPMQISAMCGFLPSWIYETELMHDTNNDVTMKDRLIANYPFYMGEMNGGELTNDGVYKYPGDEDLFPLVRFSFNGELCFIFQYSMVGTISKDGSTWVTRMD